MNIEEFEQKVRQCIYYTNQAINQVYSCTIGSMRVIYQFKYSDIEWVIITPTTSAYGDTLEECVQTIANAEGVRYFPGIVPTKQQFITTVESYLGTSNVEYRLFVSDDKIEYSAYYGDRSIEYSAPVDCAPWTVTNKGRVGSGESLEGAIHASQRI